MADLTDIQAALSTKLVGSDATGLETTPAAVTPNQDLQTTNVSNSGGVHGAITVGTTSVELKVGASALANRKAVTAFHNGNGKLYWGHLNTVTLTTGTQIFKNTMVEWGLGPNTKVWLISDTASQDIRVTERA